MNNPLVSTADVVALYQVPAGTVYRWAHEDGWAVHDGRGGKRWHREQVQASFDLRRLDRTVTSTEDSD